MLFQYENSFRLEHNQSYSRDASYKIQLRNMRIIFMQKYQPNRVFLRILICCLSFGGMMTTSALANWQMPLAEYSSTWRSVDDRVMGGVSRSMSGMLSSGHFAFAGDMSLANNGGFASVRAPLRLPESVHSNNHIIRIKIQGDGKRYQLRFRTSSRFDGASYTVSFATKPNEVLSYEFNLADFKATWRGRLIADAPPLTWTDVRQIGLMLTDKQSGEFALVIHEITWQERLST